MKREMIGRCYADDIEKDIEMLISTITSIIVVAIPSLQ